MGQRILARCRNCCNEFVVNEGGGFSFHLLHCDTCGTERFIGFDEIEEKTGNPEMAYGNETEIEKLAEKCECGGEYKFDARGRCPGCKSDDYETVELRVLYD
jgi:hypothetical protein